MPHKPQIPTYRLHRPSGRAVVTLNGKDVYLGAFDTPESKTEYQRVISEWLARHKTPEPTSADDGLAMAELMIAYLEYAQVYYKDAEGNPTREIENIKCALRPLETLYATAPAEDFGPVALKAVREKMIADNLSRNVIKPKPPVTPPAATGTP